ncbi:DUF3800 domain-containing protein [Candidatus Saccharibacteria bacterium]|nr:DUF3800 domain-containing protein [Candidatus Saccharibacteria bacterium]
MVRVYVDESGNMGTAGEYFVLAAVVTRDEKAEARLKRIIRKEQVLNAKGEKLPAKIKRGELKFSRMKFPQRQRILDEISREKGIDVFYFVAYKPKVSLLTAGKEKNLVYNYFSKLLMARVFKRYEDDFEIIFDQRSTAVKSMNSLTEYIELSAVTEFPNLTQKTIRVNQADSRTNLLLQAADVVAGAGGQAYQLHNLHFLEILGTRTKMIDEFPKRGFVGSLKFSIGKLQLLYKLRGF